MHYFYIFVTFLCLYYLKKVKSKEELQICFFV
jgi:hypothetical protein